MKKYLGEGITIYQRDSKKTHELKMKCEKCNYENARIRLSKFDVKCDNCGWNRFLVHKEIKIIREFKK